ncbi:MAG: hypothetical protein PVF53_12945 [Desulfobacterales bacterium]|jgi:hypothetical protein
MKQYVIDELRPEDHETLKTYLNDHFGPKVLDAIYWIPLDPDILTDVQIEHAACRPHYFAIDLDQTRLACELLVRTKRRVRCGCIDYATENQRNWLIDLIDSILYQLKIKI